MLNQNKKSKYIVFTFIILFFCCMMGLLFREHWNYMSLTPIPKEHKNVKLGTLVDFKDNQIPNDRAVFIHFSNPSCGCAQFVKEHFVNLVKDFSTKIQFIVVVEAEDQVLVDKEIKNLKDRLPLAADNIIFMSDMDGKIAKKVGVYSTPQAVILGIDRKLYFRGNYNVSRYSQNTKTQYAYNALQGFLEKKMSPEQLKAGYAIGCVLPSYLQEKEKGVIK